MNLRTRCQVNQKRNHALAMPDICGAGEKIALKEKGVSHVAKFHVWNKASEILAESRRPAPPRGATGESTLGALGRRVERMCHFESNPRNSWIKRTRVKQGGRSGPIYHSSKGKKACAPGPSPWPVLQPA